MDIKRYNDLLDLSREIQCSATEKLNAYLMSTYFDDSEESKCKQMQDYLFVAEESSAYFLANAIGLLAPEAREKEIEAFTANLRRIVALTDKKAEKDGN